MLKKRDMRSTGATPPYPNPAATDEPPPPPAAREASQIASFRAVASRIQTEQSGHKFNAALRTLLTHTDDEPPASDAGVEPALAQAPKKANRLRRGKQKRTRHSNLEEV